jgi:hypothetical protein
MRNEDHFHSGVRVGVFRMFVIIIILLMITNILVSQYCMGEENYKQGYSCVDDKCRCVPYEWVKEEADFEIILLAD